MIKVPTLDDPRLLPLVPSVDRDRLATLWTFDARLAQMRVRSNNDLLTAIRLRWWTEATAALTSPSTPEPADPMLRRIRMVGAAGTAARLAQAHEALLATDAGDAPLIERGRALGWAGSDQPASWVRVATAIEHGAVLPLAQPDRSRSAGLTRAHRALDAWAQAAISLRQLPSERRIALIFLRLALFGR